MIKINVITKNINWLRHLKRPQNYLDRKINKFNSKDKEFKNKKIFCTLLLAGDKEILHLNKKFRKKNKTTDVLSFPFFTKNDLKKKLKTDSEIYVGDIIINLNKIKNKDLNKEFKMNFDHLWIHGLLHLFGYDHNKDKDFFIMRKVEKKYFNLVNV